MFYQTNLDCHLAHTFSWHGPKASTAILLSEQSPKFSRTNLVLKGSEHTIPLVQQRVSLLGVGRQAMNRR